MEVLPSPKAIGVRCHYEVLVTKRRRYILGGGELRILWVEVVRRTKEE